VRGAALAFSGLPQLPAAGVRFPRTPPALSRDSLGGTLHLGRDCGDALQPVPRAGRRARIGRPRRPETARVNGSGIAGSGRENERPGPTGESRARLEAALATDTEEAGRRGEMGERSRPTVAIILTGGGARAAYQVGVLRALSELVPPDVRT